METIADAFLGTIMARVIAIGDIHGGSNELRHILSSIDPQPSDTIVAVGDISIVESIRRAFSTSCALSRVIAGSFPSLAITTK